MPLIEYSPSKLQQSRIKSRSKLFKSHNAIMYELDLRFVEMKLFKLENVQGLHT